DFDHVPSPGLDLFILPYAAPARPGYPAARGRRPTAASAATSSAMPVHSAASGASCSTHHANSTPRIGITRLDTPATCAGRRSTSVLHSSHASPEASTPL